VNSRAIECPWCGSGLFPNCCIVAKHEHDLEQRASQRREQKKNAAREDARVHSIDFIARVADAWDFKGQNVFRIGGSEHRALLELARLPRELCEVKWADLTGDQRQQIVWAARRAIEFGRQCAWIFGEGQGAR
jgi:hypothetical protein